jgi:DICT domain-containing protein
MGIRLPILAALTLIGAVSQASAQTSCPELVTLRREASEASRHIIGVPTSERCVAYNRFSAAWAAIAKYANDHREQCEISADSLGDFEKRHVEAKKARDNICAGRPAQPFPPEIIQR